VSSDLAGRLDIERHRRFVGRVAERDLFRSALAAAEMPFNVLYVFGSGGVGKTTLLREFASICKEAGVPASYVDARNLEPSPDAFMGALSSALGLTGQERSFGALASKSGRRVVSIDTYEALGPLNAWMSEVLLPPWPGSCEPSVCCPNCRAAKGEHAMSTRRVENGAGAVRARSASFERFAGLCAILAGICGLLFAVAFIVPQSVLLSGLSLTLSGLLSTAAFLAVYERLRETDASFALLALVLGVAGTLGSAVHGGYDLANAINPPPSVPDLPNPVDPRGLLTFGVAGAALFVVGWLIGRGGRLPRGLGYLAYTSAVLLLVLYLGRLIVIDTTNPVILVPALLNGFLVNPLFYILLGLTLLRGRT